MATIKKIGGGSLKLADGRVIQSGETFEADLSTIPGAFRHVFQVIAEEVPVETKRVEPELAPVGLVRTIKPTVPVPSVPTGGEAPESVSPTVLPPTEIAQPVITPSPPVGSSKYEINPRGAGWFDVVDSATGVAQNTSALRIRAAEQYKQDLEAK